MSEIERPTSPQDEGIRRAVLVGQNIGLNSLLFVALGVYLAIQNGAWQGYAIILLAAQAVVGGFVGALIIRRGRPALGSWIMLISNLAAPAFASLIVVNLGYVAAAYILLSAYFIVSFAMLKKAQRTATIVTILVLILPITSEILRPTWRLASSVVLTVTPIFTGILVAAFVVIVFRQAWSSNIRNRLVASFLVLVILPLGISGVISATVLRRAALNDVYDHLASSAALKENSVNAWVRDMEDTLKIIYHTHEENAVASVLLDTDVTSESTKILVDTQEDLNLILDRTEIFQELFILDLYGKVVASTDSDQIGKVYENQEFFRKGQADLFVQSPQYSQSLGEIVVIASRPLRNNDGKVAGVIAGRANLASLNEIMSQDIGVGLTGETYLVRSNHALLTDSKFDGYQAGDTYIRTKGVDAILEEFKNGTASYLGYRNSQVLGAYRWLPDLEVILIAEVEQDDALSAAYTSTITNAGVAVGAAVIAVVAAFLVTRTIADPLSELAEAAGRIAAGGLGISVQMKRSDEIGVLANAFNNMARQLSDLIATLEQRVSDRTKALATSSEVSRRLSTILNRRELVIEVVEQVKSAFEYYHVHIYLYNDAKDELIMAGGTGDVGAAMLADGHKVLKGRGLVGRAAENNEAVLVTDTSQDPDWLPNPLLPDTRSEAAIPISVGDRVLGVLDVQHSVKEGLDLEDVDALQSIANQVAVAIQNINQYENTQKVASDLGVVAEVGIATATITEKGRLLQEVVDLSKRSFNLYHVHIYLVDEGSNSLELASGAGEVGRQMVSEGRSIPLDSEQSLVARAARTREGVVVNDVATDPDFLPNPLLPKTRAEMAVPMLVAGRVIGVLDVQSEQIGRFTEVDINIKSTLASQIAVALENARSFELTQKHAERETKLNLITQKIQNASTIEEAMQVAARELGHALGRRQTLVALDPAAMAGESKVVVND